jgi:hypothetical protein
VIIGFHGWMPQSYMVDEEMLDCGGSQISLIHIQGREMKVSFGNVAYPLM